MIGNMSSSKGGVHL